MRNQLFPVFSAAVLSAGLTSGTVQAASACNALAEQQQCAADNACRWVAGYQRKDGIDVRGHCRSRGRGKADDGSAPTAANTGGPPRSR